jgi:hypothetical protein
MNDEESDKKFLNSEELIEAVEKEGIIVLKKLNDNKMS